MKIPGRKGANSARPAKLIQTGTFSGRAPSIYTVHSFVPGMPCIFHFPGPVFLAFIIFISFLLPGCENSMEKIKTITKNPAYPTLSRINSETYYSDSSRIKVRVWAAKLERYTQTKDPYINFPEGILVYFYDTAMNIESEISAHSAVFYENKNLWIARDDVVAKNNNKGDQLNTEELFWNQNTHKIYSEKFSRIQSKDGVTIGENGFEANQNFTWWRIKNTRGDLNIKDEP
jgi:LPS export ABC transporter protein LptC